MILPKPRVLMYKTTYFDREVCWCVIDVRERLLVDGERRVMTCLTSVD